ncbi:hypothetical protein NX059_004501 [Plenodomus lindquistii]|nr:hypothetical protein NX059_004501 [Plenodomus lindquistii]
MDQEELEWGLVVTKARYNFEEVERDDAELARVEKLEKRLAEYREAGYKFCLDPGNDPNLIKLLTDLVVEQTEATKLAEERYGNLAEQSATMAKQLVENFEQYNVLLGAWRAICEKNLEAMGPSGIQSQLIALQQEVEGENGMAHSETSSASSSRDTSMMRIVVIRKIGGLYGSGHGSYLREVWCEGSELEFVRMRQVR